jgi:hypothetical protein
MDLLIFRSQASSCLSSNCGLIHNRATSGIRLSDTQGEIMLRVRVNRSSECDRLIVSLNSYVGVGQPSVRLRFPPMATPSQFRRPDDGKLPRFLPYTKVNVDPREDPVLRWSRNPNLRLSQSKNVLLMRQTQKMGGGPGRFSACTLVQDRTILRHLPAISERRTVWCRVHLPIGGR